MALKGLVDYIQACLTIDFQPGSIWLKIVLLSIKRGA